MHVRIMTTGIRKWDGGRRRSPQRDVRRRDRYAGVYGSRPLCFGPLLRAPSFLLLLCAFLARSPHEHQNILTVPLHEKKTLSRFSFGKSFRLCDNWLPHRSRVRWSVATTPQRSMRDISHHFPFRPSEL